MGSQVLTGEGGRKRADLLGGAAGDQLSTPVTALGSALQYQWAKDNVFLAGETNATLWISAADLPDEGIYRVIVSNMLGKVFSSIAARWNCSGWLNL